MSIKNSNNKTQSLSENEILALSRQYNDDLFASADSATELQYKLTALYEFFDKANIDYNKFNLDYNKRAYPNFEHYMHVPGQHNTEKWLQAVRDIYYRERQGYNRVDSIKQITANWTPNESYDFLNWLKFYEGGNHLKYKFAQTWYANDDLGPGYFLEVKGPKFSDPSERNIEDFNSAKDSSASELSPQEKKKVIEKQRNKIIGRLDSAEKLLRSEEGVLFAGKELESLIETIYNLKKKVQLVNKISTSSKLYDDMIVREANILVKRGFNDAAELLYALADTPPTPDTATPSTPSDTPAPATPATPAAPAAPAAPTTPATPATPAALAAPAAPAPTTSGPAITPTGPTSPEVGGGLGTLPAALPAINNPETSAPNATSPGAALTDNVPVPAPPAPPGPEMGLPVNPPESVTDNKITSPALNKFLENLNTGGSLTRKASNNFDTILEIIDPAEELFVEAQESPAPTAVPAPIAAPATAPAPTAAPAPAPAPAPATTTPTPTPVLEEEPLEVSEETTSDFDSKIDNIFANVTISDIVAKLEDLAKIFKTREVPRQLAIVDMMLDSLGIASYFPSLSEATNKALESNNYISTRVDDILSKLHGAMKTKDLDLSGKNQPISTSPEVEAVKSKLQQEKEKDELRKELRKQRQDEDLEVSNKETPELEVQEDLSGATPAVPAATPAVPAPATPPAPPATPPAPPATV